MASCPGTCEGSAALTGKDAERDNPTLNAKALNSWFFFFIDADSRILEKHLDVIEFSTAEQ